jgi:hypothetical protein
MNLFSGVTEEMIDRLTDLCMFEGALTSLDIPMPDYVVQLSKRLNQATCHKALGPLLPELERLLSSANTLTMADLKKPRVTIGDSHSSAFSPKDSAVLRTNGQTLYGALKEGKIQQQLNALGYLPERVTLVYGSIDIRHHIGRQAQPIKAVQDLTKAYAELVKGIQCEFLCEVEVAAPVPVEFEGRRIPKTGFYKNEPFVGSQQERSYWTLLFIEQLRDVHKLDVAHPPLAWYHMDPEDYASTYMELSSSVHISPMHYRRYSDWSQQ